jgi:hypothetical protein
MHGPYPLASTSIAVARFLVVLLAVQFAVIRRHAQSSAPDADASFGA